MSKLDVSRAYKDAEYFDSLMAEEKARLAKNPAGIAELSESDLGYVAGGALACPRTRKGCDLLQTEATVGRGF